MEKPRYKHPAHKDEIFLGRYGDYDLYAQVYADGGLATPIIRKSDTEFDYLGKNTLREGTYSNVFREAIQRASDKGYKL